jgi:hypothetical protein
VCFEVDCAGWLASAVLNTHNLHQSMERVSYQERIVRRGDRARCRYQIDCESNLFSRQIGIDYLHVPMKMKSDSEKPNKDDIRKQIFANGKRNDSPSSLVINIIRSIFAFNC